MYIDPWATPVDLDAFFDAHLDELRTAIPDDRRRYVLLKAQVFSDWFEDEKRVWGFCLMQRAPEPVYQSNFEALLQQLPPQERTALELRAEERTDTAIADALGIDPAAVRPLLRRARRRATGLRARYLGTAD